MAETLVSGVVGGLVLVASILVGAVVAIESVVIIALLTMPLIGSMRRWLPGRRAAERRAEALLRHLLTREEFTNLCLHGYLEVRSPSHPERAYRVPRSRGTIDVYEGNRYHSTLCIAPVGSLPDDDIVAAHKLMILADEQRYLATANRVLGARWEERAPLRPPPRANDRLLLLRLLSVALATTVALTLVLHLAGLPSARDVVLTVVVGWPLVIALVSILAGAAVVLMSAVARPPRSRQRPSPGRRLA
jgi:hypothetical protein